MDRKKKFYKNFKKFYNKHILNNNLIFYLLISISSILLYSYLKFVLLTSKIEYKFEGVTKKDLKKYNYILSFWHGRFLGALFIRKFLSTPTVLISLNKSTILLEFICYLFGVKSLKGSSNRSETSTIKKIITRLKRPNNIFAIAPDGSIGPRLYCKEGVISISFLSKTPILPISFAAKKVMIFNTWDKFMIPKPFNSITISIGPTISPNEYNKKDQNIMREKLQNIMQNQMWDLDKKYKIPHIDQSQADKKGRKIA